MIRIRPMTPNDARPVWELAGVCFSDAWSLQTFEAIFQYDTNQYYVAEEVTDEQAETGRLCGFAGISTAGDTADLMEIAVLPSDRRKGVGGSLLETALTQVANSGCVQLLLEVRESNAAAQALYRRYGFETIAIRKGYYRNPPEDGRVMRRNVTGISTIRG